MRITRRFSRYSAMCCPSDSIYVDEKGQYWHDCTNGMDLAGPFPTEGDAFSAARKWASAKTRSCNGAEFYMEEEHDEPA